MILIPVYSTKSQILVYYINPCIVLFLTIIYLGLDQKWLSYMVMWVVQFLREGCKLDSFLAENLHTQRKLMYFPSCQKVQKSDFQSKFSMSRTIWFLKSPNFWWLGTTSVHNNFLLVCWFLAKNMSNFMTLHWKLM